MARQRRSGQRVAPRRKRVWARGTGALSVTGGTPVSARPLDQFSIQYGAVPIGATVARSRLTVAAARTAGVGVNSHFFMGLLVGPTSLDSVDTDPITIEGQHLDLMFWRKSYLSEGNAGGALAALHANAWEFDVKAQRRMEELSQTLIMPFAAQAGESFDILWGASILLLLP